MIVSTQGIRMARAIWKFFTQTSWRPAVKWVLVIGVITSVASVAVRATRKAAVNHQPPTNTEVER